MSRPRLSPVEHYLEGLYERFFGRDEGRVADYIPELAKADPSWFGIAIATPDGHVYEVGETRRPFTIQSISKPFVYGLALEDNGKPRVLEHIGVEPTGDAFNEISLSPESGRPRNPMINAGAIAATSLVAGSCDEDRWARILGLFSLYAGRGVELDEVVYRSERDSGHRNRAIGHMLRNFDILGGDPEVALDLYFRQCSIRVSCRDLAVMAATLATGGVNPVTRERALAPSNVDEVLSLMTTCGMYDYAGEWVYRVGMPAKSGVSGGILAVLPGQLGIGVYSPPLDDRGNSVRGVAVCEAFSDEMELHFLRAPRASLSTVRARFSLDQRRSKRVRGDRAREILSQRGARAVVHQLQGDLGFAGVEVAMRRLGAEPAEASEFVLDLTHVQDVDVPAARLLLELARAFGEADRRLVFVGLQSHARLLRFFEEEQSRSKSFVLVHFDELDLALEWCEDRLLGGEEHAVVGQDELPLAKHGFLEGIDAHERELLETRLERRDYATRKFVVRTGEAADELFLLVRGELSVLTDTASGRLRRLSTLSPGMGFGEHFLLEAAQRTAFVRADRPSTCWVLSRRGFEELAERSPRLQASLLRNLLRSSARIVERLSHESTMGAR